MMTKHRRETGPLGTPIEAERWFYALPAAKKETAA
jgi:hypothetical protein